MRRTRLKIVNVNEDEEIMFFKIWICKNNGLASACTGNPCYSCKYQVSLGSTLLDPVLWRQGCL